MNASNLCKLNTEIAKEVCKFVLTAKPQEESVTDFLLYKMSEANKNFNYVSTKQFTKHEESKNGADYAMDLELWVVGEKIAFPLIIQAKKLYENKNYCSALNYPNKSTQPLQVNKLIQYAKQNKKIPFYIFYAVPDKQTSTLCQGNICGEQNCCLYLSDAYEVKKMANSCKTQSTPIEKNDVLKKSNPFLCLFCCPLSLGNSGEELKKYLKAYYLSNKSKLINDSVIDTMFLPYYVKAIMYNEGSYIENEIDKYNLNKIKNIAVLKLDED